MALPPTGEGVSLVHNGRQAKVDGPICLPIQNEGIDL